MKNKTSNLILLSVLIMLLFSCHKDEDTEESLYEKNTALIVGKNWVPVFYGYDYNGDGILDRDILNMENALADCQMDDYWVFDNDSTFEIRGNLVTNGCGTGGGPFTWGLGSNGTDFDFPPYAGEVVTITDSTFLFYILINEEKLYYEFELAQ